MARCTVHFFPFFVFQVRFWGVGNGGVYVPLRDKDAMGMRRFFMRIQSIVGTGGAVKKIPPAFQNRKA